MLNHDEIEALRVAMIKSFYVWAALPSPHGWVSRRRVEAWEAYTEARELFLKESAALHGKVYERLEPIII